MLWPELEEPTEQSAPAAKLRFPKQKDLTLDPWGLEWGQPPSAEMVEWAPSDEPWMTYKTMLLFTDFERKLVAKWKGSVEAEDLPFGVYGNLTFHFGRLSMIQVALPAQYEEEVLDYVRQFSGREVPNKHRFTLMQKLSYDEFTPTKVIAARVPVDDESHVVTLIVSREDLREPLENRRQMAKSLLDGFSRKLQWGSPPPEALPFDHDVGKKDHVHVSSRPEDFEPPVPWLSSENGCSLNGWYFRGSALRMVQIDCVIDSSYSRRKLADRLEKMMGGGGQRRSPKDPGKVWRIKLSGDDKIGVMLDVTSDGLRWTVTGPRSAWYPTLEP